MEGGKRKEKKEREEFFFSIDHLLAWTSPTSRPHQPSPLFSSHLFSPSSSAASGKLSVTRVWSRSEVSSNALASALSAASPDLLATFGGEEGGGALEEVLTSGEVDAVLLILPVQAMPSVARRALAAGKAVLQEKPVAGTVTEALKTLEAAREAAAAAAKKNKNSNLFPVFALAENYRSEPGVLAAADAARKLSDPTSKKGKKQNKCGNKAFKKNVKKE